MPSQTAAVGRPTIDHDIRIGDRTGRFVVGERTRQADQAVTVQTVGHWNAVAPVVTKSRTVAPGGTVDAFSKRALS